MELIASQSSTLLDLLIEASVYLGELQAIYYSLLLKEVNLAIASFVLICTAC
jgi:hypothetical protein